MLKKASGIEFYESGSGQPILFLHGVGSTYESFQYQFGKISGRLIAVNIPGYGKSDSLELYNFDKIFITMSMIIIMMIILKSCIVPQRLRSLQPTRHRRMAGVLVLSPRQQRPRQQQ